MTAYSKVQGSEAIKRASGFSLIEVAIAMMVIGILLAIALQTYNLYLQSKVTLEMRTDLETVESALSKYVYRYGRYPLPAPRNAALGSATIGREVASPVGTPCPSAPAVAGAVCFTTTGSIDTAADVNAAADRVLIGDVPFATLGIKYNSSIDPWGGRLIYAVSEYLTNPATYNDSWGAIEVLDSAGATVFTISPNHAHFFIVSAGPDSKGAFGTAGTIISACGSAAGDDNENCNLDGLFRSNQNMGALEQKTLIYTPAGVSHFDDYMSYVSSTNSGIWTRVAASATGQIDISSTNPQNIKIGTTPTPAGTVAEIASCKAKCPGGDPDKASCDAACNTNTACRSECYTGCAALAAGLKLACRQQCALACTNLPRTKIDVEGSVRATQVDTDRWCYDYSSSGCLPNTTIPLPNGILSPRTLGGTPSTPGITSGAGTFYRNDGGGILCAANMAMRGIYQGEEMCSYTAKFPAPGILGVGCAAGYYAVGRNSDGTICCDNAPCY